MEINDMRVTKRNGQLENISFDKILNRIKKIGKEVNININYSSLSMKVIDQLYDTIHTTKIDELTCEQCAAMSTLHPDYSLLASRIFVSNIQKNTLSTFSDVMNNLYNFRDTNNSHCPIVSEELYVVVNNNKEYLNSIIDYERDYILDYFGLKTLERSYLFRINNIIVERPQHMWLRVAVGIHGNDLVSVKLTYDLMSQKYFTHATPTLFNSGTPRPQLSSCYLIGMEDDSLDGIFNTLKDCANISKWSGGIGLHIHNVRGNNSLIRGTNGKSTGIVPMLKVFNDTARFINQGGKRNGSFAIYLEPWHSDIEDFLDLKKNHGDEENRARDLFYGLWVSDLFMKRVKSNGKWSLFCPNECPYLSDFYGADFESLYEKYELEHKARKVINARDLWFKILDSQMETGTPYILYKDAANSKSNQKNLGTIKSSNLCVAPETLVLTNNGHIKIEELEGQDVEVWNGEEFSSVRVFKTGSNQKIIEVCTDDGLSISCTPYHKFYIQENETVEVVEAKDLKEGNKIIKCEYPFIDGTEPLIDPYSFGYSIEDYEDIVPPHNCSIKDKLEWFAGFYDANGSISKNRDNEQLEIYSTNVSLLLNVKLLLQTCGVNPLLISQNTLFVDNYDLIKLIHLGFSPKLLKFTQIQNQKQDKSKKEFIKILSVTDNNRVDDTYCFTEPKRNRGVFNGILTGQCTEIIEYSDKNETAVCNLASVALPSFVNKDTMEFDYENLHKVVKVITFNLNKIIDINFYPTEKTKRSNLLHRPIGIGVQGLADTFILMNIPFHSDKAKEVNKLIFETIYHASLERSNEIAIERNANMCKVMQDNECEYDKNVNPHMYVNVSDEFKHLLPIVNEVINLNSDCAGAYSTFIGSPISNGILQFDMWNVKPSERYDWDTLKTSIMKYGIRNSLLLAPMPTASTSQILGFNECFEPLTSNIYSRRTLAGDFILANKYLMNELIKLNIWNENLKNNIIANNGSIQHLSIVPEEIRNKYKTVWEIPMKHLIDMSADRGAFICQSQSLNLWLEDPSYASLTSMHFYSWSKGLKTGIYYLRRKAKHQPQQFTLEPEKDNNVQGEDDEIENSVCESCSA